MTEVANTGRHGRHEADPSRAPYDSRFDGRSHAASPAGHGTHTTPGAVPGAASGTPRGDDTRPQQMGPASPRPSAYGASPGPGHPAPRSQPASHPGHRPAPASGGASPYERRAPWPAPATTTSPYADYAGPVAQRASAQPNIGAPLSRPSTPPYSPAPPEPAYDRSSAQPSPAGRAYPTGPAGPVMPVRPSSGTVPRGRHATSWGQGFEHVVGWTLLGGLLPGAGLIAAGRRRTGWLILGACLAVTGVISAVVVTAKDPVLLVARLFLAHPERLTYAAVGLVVVALLWAAHLVGTTVSLRRFATLTEVQSALSWMLVTVIVAGGLGTAVLKGQEILLGRDTIGAMFSGDGGLSGARGPDSAAEDPWATTARVNVLLIGSDAGADRTGVRTDTLMVASIDTKSGETVLFSLPRNLEHVPFPSTRHEAIADYPNGFACPNHDCMINALWQFGVEHANTYYKGEANPGLTATREGVEQTLGLHIDSYAMVNLRGFMQFVDAIGGLEINVERRIPVGGKHGPGGREVGVTSYIEPGRQKLDGYRSLWYARSRSDSDDFSRMRRQRCVIAALTRQADPQTIALNLTDIMKAAKSNIKTSIPVKDLEAWVTLATRIKQAHVRSLPFTDRVISPGNPDFAAMQAKVQSALEASTKPHATATATPSPSASASPRKRTPAASASASPNESTGAVDVNAVC